VFLHALEYYSGVLSLTTNKVGKFNDTFVSRIYMSIHFPVLDVDTTKPIWKVNLRKTRESKPYIEINGGKLLRHAASIWSDQMNTSNILWNCRQIRNAFRSAIALVDRSAARPSEPPTAAKAKLSPKHFRQVADISADFDEPLRKTLTGDAFDVAARTQARHDDRKDRSDKQGVCTDLDTRYGRIPMTDTLFAIAECIQFADLVELRLGLLTA